MAAVDTPRAVDLVRSASQSSTLSNPRNSNSNSNSASASNSTSNRNRSLARVGPTKRSSNASLSRSRSRARARAHSPAEDTKSLTSFPSLSPSPETSPVQARVNGWFRSASGLSDSLGRSAENKPATAPAPTSAPAPAPAPAPTLRKITKSTQQIVGSLVATPSSQTRTALFDDTPQEPAKVPGNLHFSTDDNIEHALAQSGPVALVKQLAGDLAQRDAQITALRRRAEERERILRKMLQECEVSNMDIENRLRGLDRTKEQTNNLTSTRTRGDSALSGLHPDDPMEDRLARAMEDEVATHPDALGIDYGSAAEVASVHSVASEVTRDARRANWKSYIWTGNSRNSSRAPSIASLVDRDTESPSAQGRPRASSGSKPPPRKALANDLFVPPSADKGSGAIPALRRLQSHDRSPDPSSRRSSTASSVSLASWALKMVAGNSQASSKASTVRGRKRTDSDIPDRTPSAHSTKTAQSARSSIANVQQRGRALGPNGTIKNTATDVQKLVSKTTSPQPPNRTLSNLGPVEMDRILPEESRPPTLVQHHNRFTGSSEYLTDRFGFIYDQRRKKRQSEAAAALAKQKRSSNVESLGDGRSVFGRLGFEDETDGANTAIPTVNQDPSRPSSSGSDDQSGKPVSKTWADYLKLATHPTELLSHTPSAAPITSVESAEAEISTPKPSQITLTKRGSLPTSSTNPEPLPSRILSSHAELSLASPALGPSMPVSQYPPSQADPVKSLLDQMSELHDNLQKERTVRWNEFLRKVRAERKREGDAGTAEGRSHDMPETLLTDGEMVGMASLGNKGKVGRAKWQEFRRLVLEGIPVVYRAKVWAECSGATALRIPGYYEDLVNNGTDDPTIAAQIQMDITRTLTDNIFFRTGPGVAKLNEVLLAYSRRNPEVGYCQGMNLITAYLLLILPTSEDAFWMLATMIENILPQNYYDAHLLTSRADQSVLRSYVVELLPRLSQHLDYLEIELEALTFQWFLSVFTDCLSAEALFRVWDVVLCMHDGSTFLFQIALALLKLNEKSLLQCDTPAGVYHYINHQMTNHAISIDSLIKASDALAKVIKRKDVDQRRHRAVLLEKDLMRQREEARLLRLRSRITSSTIQPDSPQVASHAVPDMALGTQSLKSDEEEEDDDDDDDDVDERGTVGVQVDPEASDQEVPESTPRVC